jgi:hypothetical protein
LFKTPQWLFRVVGGEGVARAHVFAFILQCLVFTLLCTARDDEKMEKKIEINFHSNKNIE